MREHLVGSSNSLFEKSSWPLGSCLHDNAGRMRKSRSNWRSVCTAGLQFCLYHRKIWWKPLMAGVLWWIDTGPLPRTGWHWEKGLLRKSSRDTQSIGQLVNCLGDYGSELNSKPVWAVCGGYLLETDQWEVDKASSSIRKKTHTWRPLVHVGGWKHPGDLLQEQDSRTQAVVEVSAVDGLCKTGDWGVDDEVRCSVGCDSYKQG